MKKIIVNAMVLIFAITLFSGNVSANGDENYNDHSRDDSQPESRDLGPGEPSDNENANPAEDRTRHKDA
ncbi:hypothetical protein [Methanosarcina sp. WH1]|uniref:hypothetical protein n=1 Tax=Methanosarcina sp. WH1 TaxID=1434102 RepID=UPI000615D1D9|nr:hypothetical protein [Methanosarcina sp. WH1]AKB22913.1 hypothetical protein MSWH1_2642 [Methanosarcina sp. WH1]